MIDLRGKLPARAQPQLRPIEDIEYIVIHHSGVDADSSAESINNYHLNTLGWDIGCGYHYVDRWDGTMEWVGNLNEIRYNVKGLNHRVIGICCPGDFRQGRFPTPAQLISLCQLLIELKVVLPRARIVGHKEIALPCWETECPGDTWEQWRGTLKGDDMTDDQRLELIRLATNAESWRIFWANRAAAAASVGYGITDSLAERMANELRGQVESLRQLAQ